MMTSPVRSTLLCLLAGLAWIALSVELTRADDDLSRVTPRRPANDTELRGWLENMLWFHRFSTDEVSLATGLTTAEVETAMARLGIGADHAATTPTDRLFVLPYPGGRHPRIGFLDGAIDPQRETKVSVFTPWHTRENPSYVVVDCPEALWSNLGLTYLAHTHVPTVWSKQDIALPPQEWSRHETGALISRRLLPNGIEFSSRIAAQEQHVDLRMSLRNGSDERLSDLRVQMCVMLRGAPGFEAQTNDNKRAIGEYACVHDEAGSRWILSAWKPNHRTWFNPPCPCLHSDPKFTDCAPGESRELRGWLSFYEGDDIEQEVQRIESLKWWTVETTE